jgi:hypothetical protein
MTRKGHGGGLVMAVVQLTEAAADAAAPTAAVRMMEPPYQ